MQLIGSTGAASILRITLIAAACAVLMAVSATRAGAVQLELPLKLDYLLLDAAVKQRYYAGPGGRGQLWNGDDNCGHFYADNPRFSRSGPNVQLESQGDFEAAIGLSGQCLNAMSWSGNLVATTSPWITGYALDFRITDLNFYDADGNAIGGAAFGLVKQALIDELGSYSYDLRPHLRQLQALTDGLPPTVAGKEVKAALASLRLAPRVVPQDDGIEVALQLDVPESLLSASVAPLTAAEKASWRDAAASVSAFVSTMATQTQALMPDAQLRDEVARVAADARARVDAAANAPPAGGDPLPLFRDDWQHLRAALTSAARRGSLGDQTEAVLAALAAGDAVFALDQRAPGLGSQISRAGLQRLTPGLPAPPPPAQQ